MRRIISLLIAMTLVFVSPNSVMADGHQTLITNVRVFDGKTDGLSPSTNVLVEKNLIKEIGSDIKADDGAVEVASSSWCMIDVCMYVCFL